MAGCSTESTRSFWRFRLSGIIGFGFAHRTHKSLASPVRTKSLVGQFEFLIRDTIGQKFKLTRRSKRKKRLVKQLAILGSTGSIGRQCLSVVEALPGRFGVVALAAGSNLDELVGQIARHKPEVVSVGDSAKVDELVARLKEKGIDP